MNILYLINHAGKGGTEKYVFDLIQAYNGKDDVKCFFAYNEEGPLLNQMLEDSIPTFYINMKNPFDLKAAKKLAKICEKYKIDVVHAQFPRENYVAILAKRYYPSIRVVYTCHLIMENTGMWKFTNPVMTKSNHKILAVCSRAKEIMIQNGVSADKIKVVLNGIETQPLPKDRQWLLDEFNISEDCFIITTLARNSEEKGLDYLVRSMETLRECADRPFKCLIVGDGELFDDIKSLIYRLDLNSEIIQTGFRTDANKILAGSDMFVNSSKSEALSFSILEALSNGLPVVATNVGGNGDVINGETKCGALVEYGDESAMAFEIKKLMEDPVYYVSCAENAVKTAKEKFSFESMIRETFEAYKE